jgi:hypothetical protein
MAGPFGWPDRSLSFRGTRRWPSLLARYRSKSLNWKFLVRLVASGICHTDIDFCDSSASGAVVLGHEGARVVERVGKRLKGVRVGEHLHVRIARCESNRRLSQFGCIMKFERQGIEDPPTNAKCMLVDNGLWK